MDWTIGVAVAVGLAAGGVYWWFERSADRVGDKLMTQAGLADGSGPIAVTVQRQGDHAVLTVSNQGAGTVGLAAVVGASLRQPIKACAQPHLLATQSDPDAARAFAAVRVASGETRTFYLDAAAADGDVTVLDASGNRWPAG